MIKKLSLFLLLLLPIQYSYSNSQREEIVNFEKESIPIINDELRKLRNDINNRGDVFAYQSDLIADDATVSLPDASYGVVTVSCNSDMGVFLVESDGTVTKISGTTDAVATDTDAKLCVYDGGTRAIVKNRLGVNGEIVIRYNYN